MNDFLSVVWEFVRIPLTIGSLELPFSLLQFALQFVLPFILGMFLLRLVRGSLVRVLERSKLKEETRTIVVRWVKITIRVLLLALFFMLLAFLLGAQFNAVLTSVWSILNESFISSGDLQISVVTLLAALPIFYLANWAGMTSRVFIEKEVLRRIPVDASRRFSIANIARYAVMMLVLIIGLSIIGIDFSSLIVIFSVLGIGIGFGLQGLVANFFAGLIIIITRPIKEGDFIITASTAEPVEGHVVRITLLHSVINTLLNETIIVPNTNIISSPVHNYSYDDSQVTVPMDVGVHYDSDLDQVEEVLMGVGRDCPFWNKHREPRVLVTGFGNSSIDMRLLVRIVDGSERFLAMSWLRKETWRRFKASGVVIPYPQMDLYIKEGIPGGMTLAEIRAARSPEGGTSGGGDSGSR
jgi:potassium efflux system protein